jgi:hypothetical protein
MDDWVPVFIPKSRLREAQALVLEAVEPSDEGSGSARPVDEAVGLGVSPWPAQTLERCYLESSPHFRRWLNRLADDPGIAISIVELGKAVHYDSRRIASMLGTAGRRIDHRYSLPFPWRKARHSDDGLLYYTMSEEDAAVINRIRTDK